MTRTKIIGVGLGLGALALGSIMYKAADQLRRRRESEELDQRLDTWEAEGGAPPPQPMPPRATYGPSH